MTVEQRSVRQTTETPAYSTEPVAARTSTVIERTGVQPSGGEMLRRLVTLIFGIVQVFIGLRVVLLLLNAREGNGLVSFILDVSQLFVAPFVGIFSIDALHASGSVLDIAAVAALVGWTILELVVLWAVNLMRREPV